MEATRTEMVLQTKRTRRSAGGRFARAAGFGWLLPNPSRLRTVAAVLKLYQVAGLQSVVRATGLLGLAPGGLRRLERSTPRFHGRFFTPRGQVIAALPPKRAKVALLSGCVMPLVHGPTMDAVTRVLSRNGVEVVVPRGQACCGALNVHAGDRERARSMARRLIDALLVDGIDAVVVASAGCGSTMKEYGQLLRSDPRYAERAERFGKLTRDVHEFLAALPLDPPRARLEKRVTYQDACHLAHAQRVSQPPRKLLRAIPGLELVEMSESSVCCGAGGTYSLQQPEMSARLAARKANNIDSSDATVVATSNPGCAIQMENALERLRSNARVAYVVDLLDQAYRLERSRPS
jgi:glycolate oxidase iron-sulfur subunit